MTSEKNPNTRPLCDAHFIDFHSDVLTVASTQALPPGSRISFLLTLEGHPQPLPLHGKITRVEAGSKGASRLVVRLHSLTKEQRTALLQKK